MSAPATDSEVGKSSSRSAKALAYESTKRGSRKGGKDRVTAPNGRVEDDSDEELMKEGSENSESAEEPSSDEDGDGSQDVRRRGRDRLIVGHLSRFSPFASIWSVVVQSSISSF